MRHYYSGRPRGRQLKWVLLSLIVAGLAAAATAWACDSIPSVVVPIGVRITEDNDPKQSDPA